MSVYDFSAKLSNGENKNLAEANFCSSSKQRAQCGFTPQYKGLQEQIAGDLECELSNKSCLAADFARMNASPIYSHFKHRGNP
jgi:hypothetical protein